MITEKQTGERLTRNESANSLENSAALADINAKRETMSALSDDADDDDEGSYFFLCFASDI